MENEKIRAQSRFTMNLTSVFINMGYTATYTNHIKERVNNKTLETDVWGQSSLIRFWNRDGEESNILIHNHHRNSEEKMAANYVIFVPQDKKLNADNEKELKKLVTAIVTGLGLYGGKSVIEPPLLDIQ